MPANSKKSIEATRDSIMFVGLNPASQHEAKQLQNNGNKVIYIGNSTMPDTILVNGKKLNLQKDEELEVFVKHLNLSKEKAGNIFSLLKSGNVNARDELATIALIWAKAENGRNIPKRIILSGHSVGSILWGDGNGTMTIESIRKLAEAMPSAAAQVEDLHISACYSASLALIDQWRIIFPNILTIWAYSGSAPGSYTGSVDHQRLWDRATRGDKQSLDRLVADRTRKGNNVAVWSKIHGYQEKNGKSIEALRIAVAAGEPIFREFFLGNRTVENTQSGPLRDHYSNIQSLLQHPDVPPNEKAVFEKMRDVTIRLIYFDKNIKANFALQNAIIIRSGYRSLGMPEPNYSLLSRKECLGEILKFKASINFQLKAPQDAVKLYRYLHEGLQSLNPAYIPENWI